MVQQWNIPLFWPVVLFAYSASMPIVWRLKTKSPPQKLGRTPFLNFTQSWWDCQSRCSLFFSKDSYLCQSNSFSQELESWVQWHKQGRNVRAEKVEWLGLDKVILIIYLFLGSGSPALPWLLFILWSSVKCISLFSREKEPLFLLKLAGPDKYCLQVENLNEYGTHLWCTLQMDEALPNNHTCCKGHTVGNELSQKERGYKNYK